MKKTNIKILTVICIIITAVSVSSAFDWPQNEIMSDSFFSYFAQLRGKTISSSLIFSESQEVKAADFGRVLSVITEHDESELFESPLGNAVILSHKDNLATVYANLDSESLTPLLSTKAMEKGEQIGITGYSGWQQGDACLEFQALDTRNGNYINPRILMPRIGKELELTIKNVRAKNKKGELFYFDTQKKIAAGVYTLYRDRQPVAMPSKTTIYINGAEAEQISYETLTEKDGKLCISGKKRNYSIETVYPDSHSNLLGEITIPKGRNTVTIVVSDILKKEKHITFTIEAK